MNVINSDERGFRLDSDNLENLEREIESVCFTKPFLDRLQNELIKNNKGNVLDTIARLKENDSEDNMTIVYKKPKNLTNENFERSNDEKSNNSIDSESLYNKFRADFPKRVYSETRNINEKKETNNIVEEKIMNEIGNFIKKNKMGNSQIRLSKKDNKLTIEFVDNKKKIEDEVTDDDNIIYKYCKDFSFNTWMILVMASIIIILLLILFYRNS